METKNFPWQEISNSHSWYNDIKTILAFLLDKLNLERLLTAIVSGEISWNCDLHETSFNNILNITSLEIKFEINIGIKLRSTFAK